MSLRGDDPLLIHAAAEAMRLLDYFGVTSPEEISLEDMAAGLDLEVRFVALEAAEAHLIRVGDVGTITVNSRLAERGAQRFAIGHELGHWQMHREISQAFFCSAEDLREYRNNGRELEANTFAAELLMPKAMIDPKLLSQEPDWSIIQRFASQFNVTPITAAVRYAELARHPVIAVFSDGRNVRWWRENRLRARGLWLESRQALSMDSICYHLPSEPDQTPTLEQVPWDAWFPHIRRGDDAELFEIAAPLDDKGMLLSLLWMPGE